MRSSEPNVDLRWYTFHWVDVKIILQIAFGIILIAIVFFVLAGRINHVDGKATLNTCQKVDTLGKSFISFIDSTVERSNRAARATLASPTATEDQKKASIRNLIGLKVVQQDAHNKVRPLHCTDKGIKVGPTQPTRSTPTPTITPTTPTTTTGHTPRSSTTVIAVPPSRVIHVTP